MSAHDETTELHGSGTRAWSFGLALSTLLVVVFIVWTLTLSARVDRSRVEILANVDTTNRLDRVNRALLSLERELVSTSGDDAVLIGELIRETLEAVDQCLSPPLAWPEVQREVVTIREALSTVLTEPPVDRIRLLQTAHHAHARVSDERRELRAEQARVSQQLDDAWRSLRALLVGSWMVAGTLVALAWLYRREAGRRRRAELATQELAAGLALRVEERTQGLSQALEQLRAEMQERRRAEEALRASERFLEQAQEVASIGSWVSHPGDEGRLIWSKGVFRIFGVDPDTFDGRVQTFFEMVHPDDRASVRRADEIAKSEGTPYNAEHRIIRGDGETRWVHERGEVIKDPEGGVVCMIGTVQDITERKVAEERQTLLVRELDHRVKNNLAMILALSERTAATAPSLEAFQDTFSKRVHAMARTHEALARRRWSTVDLRELLTLSLASLLGTEDQSFSLDGPPASVAADAALPLALALNELATNAVKYGALSTSKGRVSVQWTVVDDRCRLEWRESGGPTVAVQQTRGLGLRLLEGAIGHELRGEVKLDFDPAGLRVEMTFPVARHPRPLAVAPV